MLLTFRLASISIKEGRVWPYFTPDFEWMFNRRQKFSCRYGHDDPDKDCGCGIVTTLNYTNVVDVWRQAKVESEHGSLCWVVVQVLGTYHYDERATIYSYGVYQWGFVQPLWCDAEDFSRFHRLVRNVYRGSNGIFPAWYDHPDEAFNDIEDRNDRRAVKYSWKGERYDTLSDCRNCR